jgi:stage III sporulation protein AH
MFIQVNRRDKMFKIKRPAIIGLLLVLLIFTGYLNYQLTQQALLKASTDYNDYEVGKMEILEDTEVSGLVDIEELAEVPDDYIDIVDSVIPGEGNVASVISAGNDTIKDAMASDISKTNRNYFVEYRLSRDKLRANLVDRLDEIVNNNNTTEAVRTEAQEEIIKLGNISQKELEIEGLIKSKGFTEALTFIADKDIKIVVDSNELTEQDMVKILDIVKSETTFDMNNIKIMKKQ